MEVKLTLRSPNDSKVRDAVKQAVERRSKAKETIEEAFERVGTMKLSDKERELYEIAKRAYFSGVTGRLSEGALTKGEVLAMGTKVQRENESAARQRRISETLRTKPENYHILTRDEELPGFIERIREEVRRQRKEWRDRFAILGVQSMTAGDFEGTGVDTYIDLSIGFSIWLPLLNEGYYLPYGHVDMRGVDRFDFLDETNAFKLGDSQLTRSKVLTAISPYLSQPTEGKTFHMGSARYDLHVAIKDGYEIHGCVWDTLDAMNMLNEHEESYGLKSLIAKYGRHFGVNRTVFTFEDLFGNRSPAPFNTELVGIYAINDVYYGWKLFEWQFEMMSQASSADGKGRLLECYAKIDSKLPETDVFLCRCGFEVDIEGLRALEAEFIPALEQAKNDVLTAYNIDDEFVRKMDRTLHAKKIADWIAKQERAIQRREDAIKRHQEIISDCESRGKTETKRYKDAVAKLRQLKSEQIPPADEEHAPLFTPEFSITNGNHLAYLIYDYLGITDVTPKIKRGKSRSTAADVLEVYYEKEEALKPLATVAAYEKLLNTYVTKIPQALEVDGRIHSEFKAGGTATGRYSSSGYSGRPNSILDEFKTKE
ncbi:DNA polymerase [Paenibacillus alvei]|uniref:DNA polymerase n=1 Tax=Paenibacillus alvei TaxID=44250 RepID=UPI001F50AE01|nr:DNA polymerase [Paenibacillus alvei]MCY9577965.1 DNA polymerase [Paenibacillus alvei]MCY9587759.1 DNA polymerase [Paenibacillus alvei]